jgi:hypothetical protein
MQTGEMKTTGQAIYSISLLNRGFVYNSTAFVEIGWTANACQAAAALLCVSLNRC